MADGGGRRLHLTRSKHTYLVRPEPEERQAACRGCGLPAPRDGPRCAGCGVKNPGWPLGLRTGAWTVIGCLGIGMGFLALLLT